MCPKCKEIKVIFKEATVDPYHLYLPTLYYLKEKMLSGGIDLYAGDCPIDEVENNLKSEIHSTICHYFKCDYCNQIFFVGSAIHGTPTFSLINDVSDDIMNRVLWGRYGSRYQS